MLSSLLSFFGCNGQSKEKEEIKKQIDQSLEDFMQRPIYSVVTTGILDTISDDKLEQTIIDNIFSKIETIDSYEDQYEVIKSLSRGRQAIFATWVLEAEVNNGGFNQYFYNFASSGQYAEEARDGFRHINAIKHSELTQKAMNIVLKDAKRLSKFKDSTLESFSESYENNPLNPLDSEFYTLNQFEDTSKLRIKYIRDHITEFVDK
jgi:hypothetical protein